jgi:RNA-directed DNA polymerase
MRALIKNVLKLECDKHVLRHFEYLKQLQDYVDRKSRREGKPVTKKIYRAPWWSVDDRFNPFKIRTKKRLEVFAHTLAKKVRNRSYRPGTALVNFVPKEDGSPRRLNIFQLPDAAISTLVYKSLLHKNLPRLSSHAYAYREDRTPHDAVNEIFSEWKNVDRVYVAEYDFSKFFDEISHDYLWETIGKHKFIVSPSERNVIDSFLKSSAAELGTYPNKALPRVKGIPQGTSISLFLANIACWELDRSLERLGVGFARYADDMLIWSREYDKVVCAYYAIDDAAALMGVPLNLVKSSGISLLSRVGQPEMKVKDAIGYLGYEISLNNISMADKAMRKIKARISFLIYQNLLQPLIQKKIFNGAQLTPNADLDYITALRQLRFYLYGGLTEDRLRQYMDGRASNLNFRGVMSYYPLVTDIRQLAYLDGWLEYTLRQALKLRQRLWLKYNGSMLPGPIADWIEKIKDLTFVTLSPGVLADLRLPSFRLINRALRYAITQRGIRAVVNPAMLYY